MTKDRIDELVLASLASRDYMPWDVAPTSHGRLLRRKKIEVFKDRVGQRCVRVIRFYGDRREPAADLVESLNGFQAARVAEAKSRGEPMFMGLPDRWYAHPGPKWRCLHGHVSKHYIGSERFGPQCPKCYGCLILTFPEDCES